MVLVKDLCFAAPIPPWKYMKRDMLIPDNREDRMAYALGNIVPRVHPTVNMAGLTNITPSFGATLLQGEKWDCPSKFLTLALHHPVV
jgi:hypothetical protein